MRYSKICIIVILIFTTYTIFSQTSTSVGGNWNVGTTWLGGSVPSTNNSTIVVDGTVESNIDLTFNNNVTLTINANDTLTVNGNLSFNNGAELSISAGAVVIVRGNFVSNNNLDLDANAYLIVLGDLTLNNNSDVNSTTTPSQVFVGGEADWGNGTSGNVLDCPGGTGYDSDCNFGNIIDLINDPIFENIGDDCTPAPFYNAGDDPSSNSPVEAGSTLNLSANPNPGTGANFNVYAWSGPSSYAYSSDTDPNTSIADVSSSNAGDYVFVAFTDAGCYIIDTIQVVISESCNAGTIGTDNTICSGNSAPEITSLSSPQGSGPITLSWYSSDDSSDPTIGTWAVVNDSTRESLYPGMLVGTTSYYRHTTAGSCSDTSNVVTVTANPQPTATITIDSAHDTLCDGDPAPQMNINFTAGVAPYDFTITDGTISESLTNISANPYSYTSGTPLIWIDDGSTDTDYTYRITILTDSNGCTNVNQGNGIVKIYKIPQTGPLHHIHNSWDN